MTNNVDENDKQKQLIRIQSIITRGKFNINYFQHSRTRFAKIEKQNGAISFFYACFRDTNIKIINYPKQKISKQFKIVFFFYF